MSNASNTSASGPPFRADHVGSLLRPGRVQAAHERARRGEISAAERRATEDAAIREVIAMQESVGLPAVTDGELRRGHFLVDFLLALEGIAPAHASYAIPFKGERGQGGETRSMLVVNGKIRRTRAIVVDDFEFLAAAVTNGMPKLSIPSPTYIHMRGDRRTVPESIYPDIEEFWADVVAAYHAEMKALAAVGCRYLQIDEVVFAFLCDERIREHVRADGIDPDRAIRRYAAVVDAIAAGAPPGMVVTVHTCRGNHQSMWMAEGGYEPIAEAAFSQPHVRGYFLEYDTARAGSFEPLKFVPRDKHIVLGLVSTKRAELESKDALKRRIDEASRYVPLERLALSPQCGFASTEKGNSITPDIERRKLELIVETAREVWGAV
ncbi:MAG: 5-methyltetrahydropteroyltriglutamate--homocysteine S-methyltransferase [Steroidobacteraceae bacterium]